MSDVKISIVLYDEVMLEICELEFVICMKRQVFELNMIEHSHLRIGPSPDAFAVFSRDILLECKHCSRLFGYNPVTANIHLNGYCVLGVSS